MRIETSLAGPKGQEFCELQKEKKNKSKSRKRHKKSMPRVVQNLFETCKEVFATCGAGTVPSPGDVERLRLVLDSMTPADVGLTQDMAFFRTIENESVPPITYLHLHECDKFSIGIFCLPPSGVIPLHNHPGMTVFSKLLFGSMHIKSYDWVHDVSHNTMENLNPSHYPLRPSMWGLSLWPNHDAGKEHLRFFWSVYLGIIPKHCVAEDLRIWIRFLLLVFLGDKQPPGIRLAKIKNDSAFTAPCNTSILYPAAGGNMHCFTAVTSCAVLDVLGPPYSDPEGRHCTYYHDFPYASFSGDAGLVPEEEREGYAWLEEREKPENFVVVGAMYGGPRIVVQ